MSSYPISERAISSAASQGDGEVRAGNKVLVRSEIKSKKPRTALFVRGFSVAANHKVQEATNHIPHHRATQTDVR